jgi:Transglutaminase-like superfamily
MTRAVLDPQVLRGAAWALRSVRSVRRQLARGPLPEVIVPAPPRLSAHRGGRGVDAVLRRLQPSCLERALVLQRWLAAHGEPRAVVVGVSSPAEFRAHAWLEGEERRPGEPAFHEITRLAP